MGNKDGEWRLELEESAQGTDFFEAPGSIMQMAEAKEDVENESLDLVGGGETTPRVETARGRRHSLLTAMSRLESVIASPAAAEGWLGAVSGAMDEVRMAFEEHVTVTEGNGGLLTEILETAPRFATEIELIKTEHEAIEEALDVAGLTVMSAMEIGSEDPLPVRGGVVTLLGRLGLHRQHGADLVYEAYNVDIASVD
jgi:hypothetical protein